MSKDLKQQIQTKIDECKKPIEDAKKNRCPITLTAWSERKKAFEEVLTLLEVKK